MKIRVEELWDKTPPCQCITVIPGGYYDNRSTLAVAEIIHDYMTNPEGKTEKEVDNGHSDPGSLGG